MKLAIRILCIAAIVVVGAVAYLLYYFYELSVDQANYMRTFTARETRRIKKEVKGSADDIDDNLDRSIAELKDQVLNKNQSDSDEQIS